MSDLKQVEETTSEPKSVPGDRPRVPIMPMPPLIEIGCASDDTHGTTGQKFEGFTPKP